MSAYCRFELLLPLRFNDGTAVPRALLAGAVLEIERHFGAASWESQVIEGIWHQSGIEFKDQLNRIFVDAEDTAENRRFFIDMKQRLKARFEQLDIWLHRPSHRDFISSLREIYPYRPIFLPSLLTR